MLLIPFLIPFISLSVQGVNNFGGIENDLIAIEEKLGKKIPVACVFYDGDLIRNGNVFKAGVRLYNYLKDKKPDTKVRFMLWDPDLGKGIDDCLLAGNKDKCRCINAEEFVNIYKRSYEGAIAKTGIDVSNVSKISKEERVRFFDAFEELNRKALKL